MLSKRDTLQFSCQHTSTTDSDVDRGSAAKLPSLATSSAQQQPLIGSHGSKRPIPRSFTIRKEQQLTQRISPLHYGDHRRATLDTKLPNHLGSRTERKSLVSKSSTTSKENEKQHRSHSVNSAARIHLTDAKSLGSASDNASGLERSNEQDSKNTKTKAMTTSIVQASPDQSSSDELGDVAFLCETAAYLSINYFRLVRTTVTAHESRTIEIRSSMYSETRERFRTRNRSYQR